MSGVLLMRVHECPAGYILIRNDLYPDQDRCLVCPAGSYSLNPVTSNESTCKQCPIGGDCPGGNNVTAKEGFWRKMQGQNDSNTTSFDAAYLFRCPQGLQLDFKLCGFPFTV
jgi:hypothetical protein